MHTFTASQTHSGQYKRYGDSFSEWDVLTDAGEADAAEWCLKNLAGEEIPSKMDWLSYCRSGGDHGSDYYVRYFAGYYTIAPIPGGYHFTRVYPYCD